jgi:hypothetical protein
VEQLGFRTRRHCPFLVRVPGRRVGPPTCRLPSGRARSLSPRDLREFCEGRYDDCPGYRFSIDASSELTEVRQRRLA